MTKIVEGKPVVRETQALDRRTPYVVELHPKYIVVRLKNKRRDEFGAVSYDALADLARKLRAREIQLDEPRPKAVKSGRSA
jgi:hypothetical protein